MKQDYEDIAMADVAFKSEADYCIQEGRTARANAHAAIQDMPLNKVALKKYTVAFDKYYFRKCGTGHMANLIRELLNWACPDREIRAMLLHVYPRLKNPQDMPRKIIGLELSFVYLLKCSEMYKIGVSKDIPQRIRMLQTGAPFPVSLVNYIIVDAAHVQEKQLHRIFAEKRASGEWFQLEGADLNTFNSWTTQGIPTII